MLDEMRAQIVLWNGKPADTIPDEMVEHIWRQQQARARREKMAREAERRSKMPRVEPGPGTGGVA
jgi:sRNA-binding protein